MEKSATPRAEPNSPITVLDSDHWQLPPQHYGPVAVGATQSFREDLVRHLLATLAGERRNGLPGDNIPLHLSQNPLGQPLLLAAGRPCLSVSFSLAGEKTWGALAQRGRVGVDVALDVEFPPGYPVWRVFSPEEFDRGGVLVGDFSRTAALLWSVKEATVKALGVGFHYQAPAEIIIRRGQTWQQGFLFDVDAGRPVKTWARSESEGWLALALTA